MFEAVRKHFERCDCLVMSAAVSDYQPVRSNKRKIKKGKGEVTIKLKPTRDILAWAGKNKKHQVVVGFALEDKALHTNAENKLQEKNLYMIVANTPSAIGADKSSVQIKTAGGRWIKLSRATKTTTAAKIIHLIERLSR